MKSTLKNIASIQTGVFAKPVAKGQIVYLQSRYFDETGRLVDALKYPDLDLSEINMKHLLVPGDVLFAAKGSKNFATVFNIHYPKSVASTSFFVIRLQNDIILPEYLAWYLNHPDTQIFLKGNALGTSMASISKAVLDNLEISVPDLKIQEIILNITLLLNREKELKQQIEILRKKQIQQQIINAIK